ncbi:MAG: hypothetical protein JWO23_1435, partial [Solirubrobacterales bacterium]|nr:hypothetical protein [Solirubrobacterales bacterium]
AAVSALKAHRRLKIKVRVKFAPRQKGEARSTASTTVSVKR